jgi:hypothetical protein
VARQRLLRALAYYQQVSDLVMIAEIEQHLADVTASNPRKRGAHLQAAHQARVRSGRPALGAELGTGGLNDLEFETPGAP